MKFVATLLVSSALSTAALAEESLLDQAGSALGGAAEAVVETTEDAVSAAADAASDAGDAVAETLESPKAVVGEAAPDFTGVTAKGDSFKLSDHKGGIVVLEWTNHGCPFVKKHYESGNMQKLQSQMTAKGVKWVRVNSSAVGKQGFVTGAESLKIASEDKATPTATVLDPAGDIGRMYEAKTTPHMYVIDKDGVLQYAGAIDSDPGINASGIATAENYVVAAVDALMAGTMPKVNSTRAYGCPVKY